MHKFTHPNGSVLYIQRPKEVADFVARQPRVLPQGPQEPPLLSAGVVALAVRLLLLVGLAIAMALAFFCCGEERAGSVVRPALTARQRASAFR